MLSEIQELYHLLTRQQRNTLLRLQVLVVLMAFAEVTSVFAIGPFMSLVADAGLIEGSGKLAQLYALSGLKKPEDFLFLVGIGVFLVLATASCFSIFTTWKLTRYGQTLGAELSSRLYRYYMQQPWIFHANTSSSNLLTKISAESNRLTKNVIVQLLQLNAKAVLSSVMMIAVFVYDPVVAIGGVLVFSIAYGTLYFTARRKLVANGKTVTASNQLRTKLMQEGFGGIKDTLLLGRQDEFNRRFEAASHKLARVQSTNEILGKVPRYIMELIAYGSVLLLILLLLSLHSGNLAEILPVLAVYALAGFKLLPAFQQIYVSITQVRSNLAAFSNLKEDLVDSQNAGFQDVVNNREKIIINEGFELRNVSFHYPGKKQLVLNNLSLEVPAKQVIGIVGASGSGKSTAIDILLGLLQPEAGALYLDGKQLNADELRLWQNSVGYVPQSIFLSNSSIRENIAFGLPLEEIDEERIKTAVKMAHLEELANSLSDGLNTRVGERGVQLSGGQRQRIGIARALYDDAEVLILDEATSALDGITEKLVMDAIHDFSGKKTIIMIAHRLSTVKQCQMIYLLDQGRSVERGTYDELVSNNDFFRKMAYASES